jgi:hypothetical protein
MLSMSDADWELLLERIKDRSCTPFLGAGACYGVIPLGAEIAKQWAEEHSYPLEDSHDLAKVAQYIAVTRDYMYPKFKIQKQLQKIPPPDFTKDDEPHAALADLPFPIYMTTNYDDYMTKALLSQQKDPKQEVCRWNTRVKGRDEQSIFDGTPAFSPSPANPVVFHLHGHLNSPASLVLTEDDYLDFLIELSRNQGLLPARIRRAMTDSSLLFLGYRLADWDFRVLFRGIVNYLEKSTAYAHVSVQLVPGRERVTEEQQDKAQQYLTRYFDKLDIRVYWGTCRDFAAELRKRWADFSHDN